jgi:hypothetical protein
MHLMVLVVPRAELIAVVHGDLMISRDARPRQPDGTSMRAAGTVG